MKKAIYLLPGLLLLAPAFAGSPPKKHRTGPVYEYVFAYIAQRSTTDTSQWNITIGFEAWDGDITVTEEPAPENFTITCTSGPLSGDVLDWPQGLNQMTLYNVPYPGGPQGIISATITPTSYGGKNIYQGVPPLSDF
jgi:hypothetical protein